MKLKTTCEYYSCEDETTHVVHWEEVGAPGPIFLCATHAFRRRQGSALRVESIPEFAAALDEARQPDGEGS